jgi:hypothetical protein
MVEPMTITEKKVRTRTTQNGIKKLAAYRMPSELHVCASCMMVNRCSRKHSMTEARRRKRMVCMFAPRILPVIVLQGRKNDENEDSKEDVVDSCRKSTLKKPETWVHTCDEHREYTNTTKLSNTKFPPC